MEIQEWMFRPFRILWICFFATRVLFLCSYECSQIYMAFSYWIYLAFQIGFFYAAMYYLERKLKLYIAHIQTRLHILQAQRDDILVSTIRIHDTLTNLMDACHEYYESIRNHPISILPIPTIPTDAMENLFQIPYEYTYEENIEKYETKIFEIIDREYSLNFVDRSLSPIAIGLGFMAYVFHTFVSVMDYFLLSSACSEFSVENSLDRFLFLFYVVMQLLVGVLLYTGFLTWTLPKRRIYDHIVHFG